MRNTREFLLFAAPAILALISKHVFNSVLFASIFGVVFVVACVIIFLGSIKEVRTELNESKK